jgi:trans-aconitate methyltransferase
VFLARVQAIEREWLGKGHHGAPECVPWMPLALSRFVMYLTDAVAAAPGTEFLEVGCGPGSKSLLAAALFDLDAGGFDIDPDMVAAALDNGANACVADALKYRAYYEPDILYLNKPLHLPLEADLERRIYEDMKPGAVLILCNAASRPPDSWEPVTTEWDINSGVWRKPA